VVLLFRREGEFEKTAMEEVRALEQQLDAFARLVSSSDPYPAAEGARDGVSHCSARCGEGERECGAESESDSESSLSGTSQLPASSARGLAASFYRLSLPLSARVSDDHADDVDC
jgi:hypothetical protein